MTSSNRGVPMEALEANTDSRELKSLHPNTDSAPGFVPADLSSL